MKFELTQVFNVEGAIRGMRNSYESWDKGDSHPCGIGAKDLELCKKLIAAGAEHRKFMRQIFLSADITAPLYWWKEFDTYKIGTVANSTSTMHSVDKKPITLECFEPNEYESTLKDHAWDMMLHYMEALREKANKGDEKAWKELIAVLPSSYLQKRTVTMSYENVISICLQRRGHKLSEWAEFIRWAGGLPYIYEFTEGRCI